MLSKILAGLLAVAVILALWYRSEATSASADALLYQHKAEGLETSLRAAQRSAGAVEKVSVARGQTEISRKEQANVVKLEDAKALEVATAWADMPIPDAVLERLR